MQQNRSRVWSGPAFHVIFLAAIRRLRCRCELGCKCVATQRSEGVSLSKQACAPWRQRRTSIRVAAVATNLANSHKPESEIRSKR